MKQQPQPPTLPPDDPGKRFTQWEGASQQDSVIAAEKRAEALRLIQQEMEHGDDGKKDKTSKEDNSRESDGTHKK